MFFNPNKSRQVFNLFLVFALICASTGIFIYFLTPPQDRSTLTFQMSMGILLFSTFLGTLFASQIVLMGQKSPLPYAFAQFFMVTLYILFVVAASISNVFLKLTPVNYFLLHLAGATLTLLPVQILNMAGIKSKSEKEGIQNQRDENHQSFTRVRNLIERIESELPELIPTLTPLKRLSERLLYSEPTKAPYEYEKNLLSALDELELQGELLLSSVQKEKLNIDALLRATLTAERALRTREEQRLRQK